MDPTQATSPLNDKVVIEQDSSRDFNLASQLSQVSNYTPLVESSSEGKVKRSHKELHKAAEDHPAKKSRVNKVYFIEALLEVPKEVIDPSSIINVRIAMFSFAYSAIAALHHHQLSKNAATENPEMYSKYLSKYIINYQHPIANPISSSRLIDSFEENNNVGVHIYQLKGSHLRLARRSSCTLPMTSPDHISNADDDERLTNRDFEDIIYDNAKKLVRFRLDEIIDKRLIPVECVHMKLFNWCKSLYQHGPFSRNKPLHQYSYESNNDVKIIVDRLNKAIDELCIASNYILRNNPFVVLHPKERLNVVKLENKRIIKIQKETKDHTHPFNEEDDKDIYDSNNYEANTSAPANSSHNVVVRQSAQPHAQQQQSQDNNNDDNDDEEDDNDLPDDPYEDDQGNFLPLEDNSIHAQTIQVYSSNAINKIRIFINKLLKTKFWYITNQQERTTFSIAVLIYNCVTELFYLSKYRSPSLRDGHAYPEPADYDKRNIMGLPSSISNGYRMNYIATIQKILESNNIREGQRDTNHYADAIMFYMNKLTQKKKYISSFPPLLPVEEALSRDYNGRYQVTNPNRGNVNVNFRNNVEQQPVVPQLQSSQQQQEEEELSPISSSSLQDNRSQNNNIDDNNEDTYNLSYDDDNIAQPPPLVSSDYNNNSPREVSPVYSPVTPPLAPYSQPPQPPPSSQLSNTVHHFRFDGTTNQVPYSSILHIGIMGMMMKLVIQMFLKQNGMMNIFSIHLN